MVNGYKFLRSTVKSLYKSAFDLNFMLKVSGSKYCFDISLTLWILFLECFSKLIMIKNPARFLQYIEHLDEILMDSPKIVTYFQVSIFYYFVWETSSKLSRSKSIFARDREIFISNLIFYSKFLSNLCFVSRSLAEYIHRWYLHSFRPKSSEFLLMK